MKSVLAKLVILSLLAAGGGVVRGNHGPSTLDRSWRPAEGLAPEVAAPAPKAVVEYRSGWKSADPTNPAGAHVHYCVFPAVRITSRQEPNSASGVKRQPAWTLPFDLVLVDAAGSPVARPVTVPTPIAANTRRELLPPPGWCGEVRGITTAPELYLQVEGRRARVIFEARPARASTR